MITTKSLTSLVLGGIVLVLGATAQNASGASAFVEDWSGYATGTPGLAAISPWNNDWNTDNIEVIDQTGTSGVPNRWIRQANGAFADGVITLSTAGVDLTGPIVRIETSVWVNAANTNVSFGLGGWAPGGWTGGPEAFNLRAKRFEFEVNSQGGTVLDNDGAVFANAKWWDVRMDIDAAANGGDGSLTFSYKDFGTSTWLTRPLLTNVNLGLTGNPAIDTPAEWTQMFIRISRTGSGSASDGRLGAISIESVPEPASIALMGLGGLLMLRRRSLR